MTSEARNDDKLGCLVRQLMDNGKEVGVVFNDSERVEQWYGDVDTLRDLSDGELDGIIDFATCKDIIVLVNSAWNEPETQYGTGYGDVLNIPGYWDWEIAGQFDYEELSNDKGERHE